MKKKIVREISPKQVKKISSRRNIEDIKSEVSRNWVLFANKIWTDIHYKIITANRTL